MLKLFFILLIALLTIPDLAGAAETTLEPITYGITEIDFDGDGQNEILVKARRENFNTHSYDVITVYKNAGQGKFVMVPFIDKSGNIEDSERTAFNPAWGCEVRQFVLSKAESGVVKILGTEQESKPIKPHGKTFPVGLKTYELRHDQSEVAGTPEWYFSGSKISWIESSQCDLKSAENPE